MNWPDKEYESFFTELKEYERSGVRMKIDGYPASPMQIVSAHMLREESTYMRDYVMDEKGKVQELDFYKVEHLKK